MDNNMLEINAHNNNIKVSVIIPVLNEEKYIEACIDSFLKQSFPLERMECLIIDGNSSDDTVKIVEKYIEKYPKNIKLYKNDKKTQSCAMNVGISAAKGFYLIRLDAHADYAPDYIEECIKVLETGKYENVGGIATTKGKTPFGETVACMMSSKFGVGNSSFRTSSESAEVDTVPFGAFRKSLFNEIGGFDERLGRNEDNEINYRIRKNGGKIFLSNKICFTYYCRDTLKGILNMAFQNGKWTMIASKLCPGSMRIRHFVPFAFVTSILLGCILSPFSNVVFFAFLSELLLYAVLDIFFSFDCSNRNSQIGILILLFPLFHISYGLGSLVGTMKMITM